ncbi:MAG: hypothetical protein HFE39_03460 [Clostridiales bacterium]|jgi:hypothetical protein|nr:hypothetical protein [Clostridiales bacterium]
MIHTKFLGSSLNGIFCVDGIDLFRCKWRTTGKCTVVLHPQTKQPFTFSVYETELGDTSFTFVAGEFRTDVWGFYSVKQ